jgi:predicted acylesterase/phospholipase RssA
MEGPRPQQTPADASAVTPALVPAVTPALVPEPPNAAEGPRPYTALCLSGGGVTGVSYLGALKTLYRQGVLDWLAPDRTVHTFIGTSVGALFALLTYAKIDLFMPHALGIVRTFLRLFQLNTRNLFRGARFGLVTGADCVAFVEKLLFERHRRANLTLADLHGLVGGDLCLVSSCIRTSTPIYFSYRSHPLVRVADAVFASMAIPFLFEPHPIRVREEDVVFPFAPAYGPALYTKQAFEHDGREYEILEIDRHACRLRAAKYRVQLCIDGCFVNNNPFMLAPPNARVLNLVLRKSAPFDVGNQTLFPYVMRVLTLGVRRIETMCEQTYDGVDRDVLLIDTSGISATNFHMGEPELSSLMARGSDAVQTFLSRHPFYSVRRTDMATQLGVGTAAQLNANTADRLLPASSGRWEDRRHLRPGAPALPFSSIPKPHGAPTIRPVTFPMKLDMQALRAAADGELAMARSPWRSDDSVGSDDDEGDEDEDEGDEDEDEGDEDEDGDVSSGSSVGSGGSSVACGPHMAVDTKMAGDHKI